MIKGISNREDSFLIGFVVSSLGLGAITLDEAYQWIYSLMKDHDDLPPYMYCLLDAKNDSDFRSIINFPISPQTTEKEFMALIGISYYRGFISESDGLNITKKKALKALEESPQLLQRFRETFPFIDI